MWVRLPRMPGQIGISIFSERYPSSRVPLYATTPHHQPYRPLTPVPSPLSTLPPPPSDPQIAPPPTRSSPLPGKLSIREYHRRDLHSSAPLLSQIERESIRRLSDPPHLQARREDSERRRRTAPPRCGGSRHLRGVPVSSCLHGEDSLLIATQTRSIELPIIL
jgi:hypothetical protein